MDIKEDGVLVSLKLLNVIGQDPLRIHFWSGFSIKIYLTVLGTNYALALWNFLYAHTVTEIASTMESLIIFSHMFIKAYLLHYNKKRVAILLRSETNNFWKIEGSDKKTDENSRFILWAVYMLTRAFIICAIFTVSAMCLRPFVITDEDERENLVFVTFIPNVLGINRKFILFFQVPMFYYTIFTIIGFDTFYVAMCTHALVQLRLLSHKMRSMVLDRHIVVTAADKSFCNDEIHKAIRQHVFLLNYCNELRSLLSTLFLGQYMITLLSTCMELYIALESASSLGEFAYLVLYLTSLYFQFGLYCFIANEVSDETENVCNAIYESDWFFSEPKMRKNLQFMMMRAQKKMDFTAAGMTLIRRETFTKVFQFSLSVLTLLRSF